MGESLRMWRWAGVLVVASVAVVLSGGCAVTTERSYAVDVPEGIRLVGVDVENFAGDVVVRAVRGGEARLDAYVTVSGDVERERRGRFREAVEVSLRVEESAPGVATVRVRSESELSGEGMHNVRLELVTPRADGVRVENRGGVVELIDVGGRIEVMNRGGGVLVRTSRALVDDVRVLNVSGDVFVQVPDGSTGALRLESLDGKVRVKDLYGRTERTEAGRALVETTLAAGRNDVDLRTSDGVVEYLVLEDPVALARPFTRRGPNYRDYLELDSSRRFTRNLPDDDLPDPVSVGEGSYYGSPRESNSYRGPE